MPNEGLQDLTFTPSPSLPSASLNHQRFRGGGAYLTVLEGRQASRDGPRYLSIEDLIPSTARRRLQRGLFSNFSGDWRLLLRLIPAPTPVTILQHHPKEAGVVDMSAQRPGLRMMYSGVPATNEGLFRVFHHKVMILEYSSSKGSVEDSFLRVVVSSANVGVYDYFYVEQVLFVQDFPLCGATDASGASEPENGFLHYLTSFLHISCCPLDWISTLQKYDFSEASVFLLGSVPGSVPDKFFEDPERWWKEEEYKGEGIRRRSNIGLGRLDAIVRRYLLSSCYQEEASARQTLDVAVEFATSSLGQLTPSFVKTFQLAAGGCLSSIGTTDPKSAESKSSAEAGAPASVMSDALSKSGQPVAKKQQVKKAVVIQRDEDFDAHLPSTAQKGLVRSLPNGSGRKLSANSVEDQIVTGKASLSETGRDTALKSSSFKVLWPTQRCVDFSRSLGLLGAGSLCFSIEHWERKDFPRATMHQMVSKRLGALGHHKIMLVRFVGATKATSKYCGYVYLGSHNLSWAAWGNVSRYKAPLTYREQKVKWAKRNGVVLDDEDEDEKIDNSERSKTLAARQQAYFDRINDFGSGMDFGGNGALDVPSDSADIMPERLKVPQQEAQSSASSGASSGNEGIRQNIIAVPEARPRFTITCKNYELGVVLPLLEGDLVVVGRRKGQTLDGPWRWVEQTQRLQDLLPWEGTPLPYGPADAPFAYSRRERPPNGTDDD